MPFLRLGTMLLDSALLRGGAWGEGLAYFFGGGLFGGPVLLPISGLMKAKRLVSCFVSIKRG